MNLSLDSRVPNEYDLPQDDRSTGTLEEGAVLETAISANRAGLLEEQEAHNTTKTCHTKAHHSLDGTI